VSTFDLEGYLSRQREWSKKTFGDGKRTEPICRHIEKEVNEIRAYPEDIMEWVDVIILALDGAWRAGYPPDVIGAALVVKQRINMERKWPDPKPDDPSEHDRSAPAVTGEYIDREPACNISGTCVAPKGAGGLTNCIYCGKELHRRNDGLYYTWDADMKAIQRPQAQEG